MILPSLFLVPVSCYWFYSRRVIGCHFTFQLNDLTFVEAQLNTDEIIDIPLTAFSYERPVDGYPLLHSWVSTAKDILYRGFEPWREIFLVKVKDPWLVGKPMQFGSVLVVKGMGRISILLWAVLHSYINMKDCISQNADVQSDFKRPGMGKKWEWVFFGGRLNFCECHIFFGCHKCQFTMPYMSHHKCHICAPIYGIQICSNLIHFLP